MLVHLMGDMAKGVHLAEYFADRGELMAADLDVEHARSTALRRASTKGYLDIVKALLAAGTDKDKYGGFGVTPLIWAATQGHLKVLQVLVKAGAKVDKADKCGDTTLMRAARIGILRWSKPFSLPGRVKTMPTGIAALP